MHFLRLRAVRVHRLLAMAIGFQLLFWTGSGAFFTIFPIEVVRGEALRHAAPFGEVVSAAGIAVDAHAAVDVTGIAPSAVTLRPFLDGPVWQIENADEAALVSATTGQRLTPLDRTTTQRVALASYAGRGTLRSLELVEAPPREAGVDRPMWRADFAGPDAATLWIDPERGTVRAVRTGIWRAFDALWRLHIMDVTGADRIDSWWLRLFAFAGLTMSLSGLVLAADRLRKRGSRAAKQGRIPGAAR